MFKKKSNCHWENFIDIYLNNKIKTMSIIIRCLERDLKIRNKKKQRISGTLCASQGTTVCHMVGWNQVVGLHHKCHPRMEASIFVSIASWRRRRKRICVSHGCVKSSSWPAYIQEEKEKKCVYPLLLFCLQAVLKSNKYRNLMTWLML